MTSSAFLILIKCSILYNTKRISFFQKHLCTIRFCLKSRIKNVFLAIQDSSTRSIQCYDSQKQPLIPQYGDDQVVVQMYRLQTAVEYRCTDCRRVQMQRLQTAEEYRSTVCRLQATTITMYLALICCRFNICILLNRMKNTMHCRQM